MITFLGSVVHIIEETYMTTLWAQGNELFDNDQETWSLWKRHNAHKNVTKMLYKEGQLEVAFGGLFCQLHVDVITKC